MLKAAFLLSHIVLLVEPLKENSLASHSLHCSALQPPWGTGSAAPLQCYTCDSSGEVLVVPDASVYSLLRCSAPYPRAPPCRAVAVSGYLFAQGILCNPYFFLTGCLVITPLHIFSKLPQKLDRILTLFIDWIDWVDIPAARHQRGKCSIDGQRYQVTTAEYWWRTAHELPIYTISLSKEKGRICHSVAMSDQNPWVTQKDNHDIFT